MKTSISILLAAACLAVAGPAGAQSPEKFPNHTVRIVVPFGPGGTTDTVARALAQDLSVRLGQSVVVESRTGADGIVALQELVRSGADGHTFMLGNVTTNAITPILFAGKMTFDYEREVVPVMRLVDVPAFLVATTKNFPPNTVAEFVDYARRLPGRVNYGITGAGSYPHYDMAVLARRAGNLQLAAIPNKGGASAMVNDLLVGTVQLSFVNAATAAGNVQGGTLKALAVVNHKRLPAFPEVPTLAEAGYPGVGTIAWQALFASAKAPKEALERMQEATAQALKTPAVVQALETQGFTMMPTSSLAETRAWLAEDMENWRKTIQDIKLDLQN
ncbi:MAG: tripartite tricarboxylate transporter substrate binding protein [Rhodoplanes sp.]|uniref:Bug family tripartite tricarboxylate transporter substrate binding protein n=1 Tax=Rhodoplanes sp. TaxID=1968906 RepID=UPI0017B9F529|nr:tripartite tricarboxylate transporter substrate binding protein [Rhodoplanes sp.]NVO12774.1 tripartite tricarboxylate transporter substrate binding protein [Rhodoplanes sp.]